jgi:MATE family multidrug resistance protein
MLAMIVGYALLWRPLRAYGLLGPWRAEPALRRKLWRLGLPFAISQGLETSAFQGLTLLCGWLGTTALAAYQIALNVSALIYMATVGLATATAVRVGHGIGAGEPRRAVAAAWLGLAVTLCVMLALAPVIALGGGAIAAGYNSDPRVLDLARHGFLVVALIIVADGAQGVMTGALRGAGDVLWPMAVHVLSFWLVLLPAAWLFAFPLGGGMQGLLAGIVAGLAVATALLLLRLSGLHRRRLGRV